MPRYAQPDRERITDASPEVLQRELEEFERILSDDPEIIRRIRTRKIIEWLGEMFEREGLKSAVFHAGWMDEQIAEDYNRIVIKGVNKH